ncbi:hypothetical protein [Mycobacterium sp. 3519A]|uniref:hypothetical protein n=1 Tax=Mycobacterium sp. 3519A TaxID=2057184 RepID=UPI000C7DF09C|nr:hypothetical protein [Mycobacterium sp. 3519A]
MTDTLAKHVEPSGRFSRSANVERDHGTEAIDGYMPTGRALDVIARIGRGLADPASGRTFSLTGPHGGGKSSLAVFLDGLLSGSSTAEFKRAHEILKAIDPAIDAELMGGMRSVKAGRSGFVRAFATARNEPVAETIARALHGGMSKSGAGSGLVPAGFASKKRKSSAAEIRSCVREITREHPLLLIIDEFGKNLEYFAGTGADGDPFLLQELAEMTQGTDAVPMVVITMQHLSFDEYVQGSSTARRREWSKVQGRFQDIPYTETPAQSRRLIASALRQDKHLQRAAKEWLRDHRVRLEEHGLRDIADDAAEAIPLHPLALAVLPDLCSRYGQNERTLFSFLTGTEPSALPQFLAQTGWDGTSTIPMVGLDLLYDYFLESSGSMIGVADGASRWIEIETRIRDTAGLKDIQVKALKTIGLLNLVSSGGRVRASRSLLTLALESACHTSEVINEVLESLVDAGLITYRAFSDEYRIWQGSDYNLRQVIENSRHGYEGTALVDLLRDAVKLEPLVAGRHSQRTGVLRVFAREFSDGCAEGLAGLDPSWDGIVRLATNPKLDSKAAPSPADARPAVYVVPRSVSAVREAAIEAAALTSALKSAEGEGADWVALSELVERASDAQQRLQSVIGDTWSADAGWFVAGTNAPLDARQGISATLSDVADLAYPDTPRVANEMIARRELTSQGAKARRFLIDALLAHKDSEAFGIEGYGPDRAMYEAIFRKTGLHRETADGVWALHSPSDRSWKPVWARINSEFDSAVEARLSLAEIGARLTLPPLGLKDGIIPLLLIAGLVARSDEVALYEHGSLVLSIDDAVAERLTKNLTHFSIKNTQTRTGKRSAVINSLVSRLGIRKPEGTPPTFLNVATALYRELRTLPPYTQRTRRDLSPEALAVREAFHQATEPDVLLFEALPRVFGLAPFTGRNRAESQAADQFADRLADTITELRNAYPRLLAIVQEQLAQATSSAGRLTELRQALAADATRLEGHVLEPRLKAFVGALARPLDDQPWLENVAMVISEGQAPRVWSDDIADRFPLRIAELGGALRRTSALLHDRLAANLNEGYSSSRMTLTRPDGTESIELLALTKQQKIAIDPHFDRIVSALMKSGGSRSAACRMLMARLAAEYDVADSAAAEGTSGEERRHG